MVRKYRRRRTMDSGALVPYRAGGPLARTIPAVRAGATAMEAAHAAAQYAQMAHKAYKIAASKRAVKRMFQTKATTRGAARTVPKAAFGRGRGRGRPVGSKNKKSTNPNRNDKLKMAQGAPMNKGKGFNNGATGTIYTHPISKIPQWKKDRIYKYKYDVWQTVMLSRSSRLPASNNTLKTIRYPLKMPETLDGEKTQTLIFTPFCSNLTGIHSTYYRKVASLNDQTSNPHRAAGTYLDHDTTNRLDVIQNKADVSRWSNYSNLVEANDGDAIVYKTADNNNSDVISATNNANIFRRVDQLVKEVHLDYVFIASRAFPVQISVSVIRQIKPAAPYTLTTQDTQDFCNGVGNHGLDYNTWKVEYHHEFTLPALRINKKIPTYSVNKVLKTNFLQTNSFNENTSSSDMSQAAKTELGLNIHSHTSEIADGNQSGNFYILIKYRKKQQPQQFTYKQVIEAASNNSGAHIAAFPSAEVELPVLTEESFDVPTNDGGANWGNVPKNQGQPFSTSQGDETKASFYLNGKMRYKWGFRKECEAIPSVMSLTESSNDYKKPQSLNIDPTVLHTNTTNGIYTQSPDHVNIAASTANTGI